MSKRRKGKRPDNRPARKRYWNELHLSHNKVRNLIDCNGFDNEREARVFWMSVRKRHG